MEKICGECKWHYPENDVSGIKILGWYCGSDESEHANMWTDYTDTCEQFEQRGVE